LAELDYKLRANLEASTISVLSRKRRQGHGSVVNDRSRALSRALLARKANCIVTRGLRTW
jgi:hypothetical protein